MTPGHTRAPQAAGGGGWGRPAPPAAASTARTAHAARAPEKSPEKSPEKGSVTAETAVVLPVMVAVVVGLVWAVSLGVTKARVVDAARESARALARDEPMVTAKRLAEQVAPTPASVTVRRTGTEVRVRVTARVRGPGGLFGFLPPVEVGSVAIAAKEPG